MPWHCGYAAPQGLEGAPKLGPVSAPEYAGQPSQAQNLRANSSTIKYLPGKYISNVLQQHPYPLTL